MRKLLAAALLAALSASPFFTAPAQAQTPIKIMVGGIDKQIYLPAKLAAQLGFFKEQGLDVELFNSTSGSQAATALLAREVQGVVGFYDHTIDLQSKGKFITDVVQFGIAPGEVVLVKAADADKLKDPANWKGHALGVTGLGSATDFLTRALAAKAGLKVQDYSLVPVGAGDTFLAAMQQGKIVSGMTTEPTVARALKNGTAKVGIDMRTPEATRAALGGDYPASCLYMDRAWMEANKETAQKVVNVFVKTLKWMNTPFAGGNRRRDAEGLLCRRPRPLCAGPARRPRAIFARRHDAARRAGIGAQGAVELFGQRAGQDDRPEQDLYDGVRDQGQRDALSVFRHCEERASKRSSFLESCDCTSGSLSSDRASRRPSLPCGRAPDLTNQKRIT